jgi:hypothetical protein
MAFNIYKWRRDQLLTENNNSDGMKEYNKKMLQQLLDWYKTQPNPEPDAIKRLEDQIGAINEGEGKITVKSIQLSDLKAGDKLPTNIGMGTFTKNPITTEEELEEWRESFFDRYGDIELVRGNLGYQASSKHPSNVQAQADFDKYAKRG